VPHKNKNEMDREKWVNKMQVMHKFATETGTRNCGCDPRTGNCAMPPRKTGQH